MCENVLERSVAEHEGSVKSPGTPSWPRRWQLLPSRRHLDCPRKPSRPGIDDCRLAKNSAKVAWALSLSLSLSLFSVWLEASLSEVGHGRPRGASYI